MPALPSFSGKEVARGFEKLGWIVARRQRQPHYSDKGRGNGHALGAESSGSCQRNAKKFDSFSAAYCG